MSKMVILFVCFAVFQIGSALQCYKCDNCQGSSSSWEKSVCGSSGAAIPANNEWVCLTLNYKDRTTYKDTVQRKCVLVEKNRSGKPTFNCPTTQGEPSTCPVCTTDLCNSASTVKFSFVAIACVVLAIVAPKLL